MKAKITITEITQEDLVILISTATYGSPWLGFQYDKADCPDRSALDSMEDIAAKILLAGGAVEFIDYFAEDSDDIYADTAHFESDAGIYPVTLESVRTGLESAFNGTFCANDRQEKSYARRCAAELVKEEPNFDMSDADALMQIIMFNEIIYG